MWPLPSFVWFINPTNYRYVLWIMNIIYSIYICMSTVYIYIQYIYIQHIYIYICNTYICIYIYTIHIYIYTTHIYIYMYIYNIYIVWINMICQYRFLNMLIRVVLKDGRFDKIFDWWWKYLGQSPTIGRPTIKLGRVTNDNKIPMFDWWQYQWYPCTVWSLSKVN